MTPSLSDALFPPGETPQPCGWSRGRVQEFAEESAKALGYSVRGDLTSIVGRLGGSIKPADHVGTTGAISVNGPKNFIIHLSQISGANRDRFTIAHEIGHYILHSQLGERAPMTVNRDGTGRLEWEANWFAAGFLMPAAEFRKMVEKGYGNAALAVHFGVSEAAVSIRRETLGL